jgi:glyoxylase-like metal-dependent hydrolase (beta-lactamase superfamily II)
VPEAVAATEHIVDGQVIAEHFEAIYTPGHTPGHMSFYYAPAKALFAGDALAVVAGRVRFMARPVTPDLPLARQSMRQCLARDIRILCPGHREPLTQDVEARCAEMRRYLDEGGKWPLLG